MKHLAVLLLAVVGLTAGTAILRAQTFNSLYSFSDLQGTTLKTNSDGQAPYGNLVLSGGTLYGTTYSAGTNGSGAVFAISTNGGGFTVLHSFAPLVNGTNADGAHPYNGLVLSGGVLYGTTFEGGVDGCGTVFALSPTGTNFSVLHVFTNGLDGAQPRAGLVISSNTLYGTTGGTGTNSYGTIFSLQTNGAGYAVLHYFSTNNEGALTQSGVTLSGGVLYGTTYRYGSNGFGSVYSINAGGSNFTILHNFAFASDGGESAAPLLVSGNTLFGTTSSGGSNGWGTVFSLNSTNFSVLHTFAGDTDGGMPLAALTLSGNTLYGTTQQGGTNEDGTIFSVRTNGGGFVLLHTFSGTDGYSPSGGLVLSGKSAFGTTTFGGTNGANGGTVYSITVPVLSITNFALIGTNITIYGVDGLAGGTYSVLANTNPMLPASQWTSLATTVLTNNGPFIITVSNAVNPSAKQQFYMLQMQ